MNWRVYIRNLLINAPSVTSEIHSVVETAQARIFTAGSVRGTPETPFVELRFSNALNRAGRAAEEGECFVHVHDSPGSYKRIDDILDAVRDVLKNTDVTEPGAITIEWQGRSGDLADDGYDTLTRNDSYKLLERSG